MKDIWKSEYEYLRRKKNKEIESLEMELSKGSHLFYDYLVQKGLLEEYMQWVMLTQKKQN